MSRSWLWPFALLLVLVLLLGGVAPTIAQEATPTSSSVEITTEAMATIQVPATVVPPLPAVFDVWLWTLSPGEELTFEAGDAPPSFAVDVVLTGAYTVRSEGRLQVQRAAGPEEVPPVTDVTVRAGDAVIYLENQTAQLIHNAGDEPSQALSFGVFSAAPPSGITQGPVGQEDWERSGLSEQDLTVHLQRVTIPPRTNLPGYVPDVRAPQIFVVAEGVAHWEALAPAPATPLAAAAFGRGQAIWFRTLREGMQLQLRNEEDQPLVLLHVTVSAANVATPAATTPMS